MSPEWQLGVQPVSSKNRNVSLPRSKLQARHAMSGEVVRSHDSCKV